MSNMTQVLLKQRRRRPSPKAKCVWVMAAVWVLSSPSALGKLPPAVGSFPLKLALKASVLQAIAVSAQLRGAQAQMSAAESELQLVQSQRLPQIQLRGHSRAKDLGGGLAPLDGAGASVGIDIVTSVFDWGRLEHAVSGQRAGLEVARAQARVTLQDLAYEVVATQLELSRQRALVRLGEQYRESMQSRVTLLESVVAVDVGRASEVLQARARFMQSNDWLESAVARLDDASLQLQRLTGQTTLELPEEPQLPIHAVPVWRLLSLVEDHPQVVAAQAQARSEEERGRSIDAASMPQVNWEVGKSTYESQRGMQQPWHTRLTLSWTAFDGGASKAARSTARSRSLAAEEAAEELRRQLAHQIRLADQQREASMRREERFRELGLQSAQIRQAFFEQWYHLGQRTLLDVLGADSEYFAHLSSEVSSRFDGYAAVVQGLHGAGALLPWLDGAPALDDDPARLPAL